jgi:hypothetical protein
MEKPDTVSINTTRGWGIKLVKTLSERRSAQLIGREQQYLLLVMYLALDIWVESNAKSQR